MRWHPSPSTARSKLPGMSYTRLTQAERYQIAILNKAGHHQSEIARVMDKTPLEVFMKQLHSRHNSVAVQS